MSYYEDSRGVPKQEDSPRSIFDPAFRTWLDTSNGAEPCDSVLEYPHRSFLACTVKGPHLTHRAREPNGRLHTWTG